MHIVNKINRRRQQGATEFIEGILKNIEAIQDATLANHLRCLGILYGKRTIVK